MLTGEIMKAKCVLFIIIMMIAQFTVAGPNYQSGKIRLLTSTTLGIMIMLDAQACQTIVKEHLMGGC